MPKDKRPFIMVTDTMPEHPKVEALSDAAFRLLVTTWCYCSRQMNDGRITAAAWTRRGTPKARRELEAAGLVELEDGMAVVHDYTEHQRTAADVQELTEKRAAAGAAGGKAKAAKRLAAATSNGLASAKQNASNGLANDQQTSSRVEERRGEQIASGGPNEPAVSGKVLASASNEPTAQTLVAEWIDHCPERPPSRVIGQVAKELQGMLNDGLPYPAVRAGLQQWQQRGLHPSTLASVVHEMRTATGRPARPATSPGGFDPAAAIARAAAAQQEAS